MIGFGSSGVTTNDLDGVLRALALVSDPVQAKTAADELRGLLQDIADKQTALATATANLDAFRRVSEEAVQATDQAAQANTKRAGELDTRAAAVEAAFARLATAQEQFRTDRDAFDTSSTAQQADLTARTARMEQREAALRQSEQEVAAMRADLQVRLDRIRAAAA